MTDQLESKLGVKEEESDHDKPISASDIFSYTNGSSTSSSVKVELVKMDSDLASKPKISSISATPSRGRKKGSIAEPVRHPLIDHLPTANEEALETFETLDRCLYEFKKLGMSREQDEMMVCDCVYDRDDPEAEPCGPHSDCINRAIFIECLADECRARTQCRNQRFSKKQYADIEIVQTEMKGFGLRAASDIPSGGLIYEYVGEVIAERTFRKRMQQYASEGIKHFYFMMLQKDEYLDATKKGGIGRFANHSCNPNCEVQKWVVGRRLRMGIFSKRDIQKGEEITFNYNVDRYGHDAQTCYCGEPNCVGFIGGKTQTDIGGMNDLFLDALGITDEVELGEMRGTKKKKSRQMDEDFTPTLRPINEEEISKVAAAIRQSMENPSMMSKLLQRVKMTEEPALQRKLMGMHGFSLMCMILTEMVDEREVVLLALESMDGWKPLMRNKIEDSKVEEPVQALAESPDEAISTLAKRLLGFWSTLELSYRIPRVSKIASLDANDDADTSTIAEASLRSSIPNENRRPTPLDAWENNTSIDFAVAPVRPRPSIPSFARPKPPPTPAAKPTTIQASVNDRSKLDAIIALAQQTVQAANSVPVHSPAPSAAAESSRSGESGGRTDEREDNGRKRIKRTHSHYDEGAEERRKEKGLTKLVGEVVVRSMSKYKEQMEHETFKRYAKECTMLLVEKEKKGSSYSSSRHPTLSEEKKAKMKAFVKDYVHKLLKKLKDKGKLRRVEHRQPQTNDSTSDSTPRSTSVVENVQNDNLVSEMFGGDDEVDTEGGTGMEVDVEVDPSPLETPHTPSDRSQSFPSHVNTDDSWSLKNGGKIGIQQVNLTSLGTPVDTPSSATGSPNERDRV